MMSRYAILSALCAALLCACGSCTRTVYTPVESTTVRTDTLYRAVVRVDTVLQRDSVTVMQRGDTVYHTRYITRYKVRQRVDTVYRSVVDTCRTEVPVPVERPLTRWQRFRMDVGALAVALFAMLLFYGLYKIIIKIRKP